MPSFVSALSVRAAFASVAVFCLGTALSATLADTAAEIPLRAGGPLLAAVVMLAGACLSFESSPRATALAILTVPFLAFPLAPLAWWVTQSRTDLVWLIYLVGFISGAVALVGGSGERAVQHA